MSAKPFEAEKFYTEIRCHLFGVGWQESDEATSHEHVEALEATVDAAVGELEREVAALREKNERLQETLEELLKLARALKGSP